MDNTGTGKSVCVMEVSITITEVEFVWIFVFFGPAELSNKERSILKGIRRFECTSKSKNEQKHKSSLKTSKQKTSVDLKDGMSFSREMGATKFMCWFCKFKLQQPITLFKALWMRFTW